MSGHPPGTGPVLDRNVWGWIALAGLFIFAVALDALPW